MQKKVERKKQKLLKKKMPETLKFCCNNKGKRFCERFLQAKKKAYKSCFFLLLKEKCELQIKLARHTAFSILILCVDANVNHKRN